MRTISVTLPEDLLQQVRRIAAERKLSMSALIRSLVRASMATGRSEDERLKALQDQTIESIESFKAAGRLSRDELYRR